MATSRYVLKLLLPLDVVIWSGWKAETVIRKQSAANKQPQCPTCWSVFTWPAMPQVMILSFESPQIWQDPRLETGYTSPSYFKNPKAFAFKVPLNLQCWFDNLIPIVLKTLFYHFRLLFIWIRRQLQDECVRPRNLIQTLTSALSEQSSKSGLQKPPVTRHSGSTMGVLLWECNVELNPKVWKALDVKEMAMLQILS